MEEIYYETKVINETEEYIIYEISDGLFTARVIKPKKWSIRDIFENCLEGE